MMDGRWGRGGGHTDVPGWPYTILQNHMKFILLLTPHTAYTYHHHLPLPTRCLLTYLTITATTAVGRCVVTLPLFLLSL